MKVKYLRILGKCILPFLFVLASCNKTETTKGAFIDENVTFASQQTDAMLEHVGKPNGKNYPRSMNDKGELIVTNMYDWTPGFFPGSLWYLYELTGNEEWKSVAQEWTESLEPLRTFTKHHDLGFMMYCSYGNAERIASKPEYKDILIESAESLSTRYDERTKAIKSWNSFKSWNDDSIFHYPVIIDNMMNLEMLFHASKVSGNPKYYDIAVAHAQSTLQNQMRDDFTTFHVVNYDTITGNVLDRVTAQGYSDNSMWARGQAWAIYGFTMVYRETKDPKFLDAAINAANVYIDNLPEDLIPYWDFNVEQEGYLPGKRSHALEFKGENLKDVSAGAIVCSALFELSELSNTPFYADIATQMLETLASPAYRATLGTNANFLLLHSVGSIPHKFEIDKPLVYADYYFLEALNRYKNLNNR